MRLARFDVVMLAVTASVSALLLAWGWVWTLPEGEMAYTLAYPEEPPPVTEQISYWTLYEGQWRTLGDGHKAARFWNLL